MSKQKVVVVSLHKTGTTSIKVLFEKLGFLVTGPDTHIFEEVKDEKYHRAVGFLERFDLFQDDPWYLCYPFIKDQYPETKFIFLEREESSWLKSVQRFYGEGRYNNRVRELFYGHKNALAHPNLYLETYRAHNQAVKEFFKNDDNFISIDVRNNTDAIRLQEFLGLNVIFEKFPHTNKTPETEKEQKRRNRSMWVRSYFGLNTVLKRIVIRCFGYNRYFKIRDRIRWYRAKFKSWKHKFR